MNVGRILVFGFLAAIAPVLSSSAVIAQSPVGVPAAAQELTGEHPAEYYKRAALLFEDGKKDAAVFIFYLGQLGFRTHLLARRDLDPTGDPAIFASLSSVVGPTINQYAFGDIPQLARTIDAVLAYDQENPDTFTSPTEFAKAHADMRDGLVSMKTEMLAQADSIRAKRLKNGLENR